MNREGHENTNFFLGTEVEHSPAYGKKTLFVVGVQSATDITAHLDNAFTQIGQQVDHIYFGANQSFPKANQHTYETAREWSDMIIEFLNRGLWCTLDFDVSCVEIILDMCLEEHDRFIPMVSVPVPYIQLLNRNYNTTVKLDDKDFAASNPGVWCHSLHTLMDRRVFTDWSQYTKDTVLK